MGIIRGDNKVEKGLTLGKTTEEYVVPNAGVVYKDRNNHSVQTLAERKHGVLVLSA